MFKPENTRNTGPSEEATSPYFQRKVILLLLFSLNQFYFFLFPILVLGHSLTPASAWGTICGATFQIGVKHMQGKCLRPCTIFLPSLPVTFPSLVYMIWRRHILKWHIFSGSFFPNLHGLKSNISISTEHKANRTMQVLV